MTLNTQEKTFNEGINPTPPLDDPEVTNEASTDSNGKVLVELSKTKFILIFLGLILSIFVAALDNTIISTALTRITSDFNALNEVGWVASSYLLTSTAFQPLYGKFSDIFGRRLTMLFALCVFLIGSILCGAAQNVIMLIVFRALAGVGGGGLISLSVIIISDIVPLEKRGIYVGMVGACFGISSVVGPLLGGVLTEKSTWRWCFYINIPVCILAISVVALFLSLPVSKQNFREKIARIDFYGSATLLIFTILFVLGMNWGGQEYPWDSAQVISVLVISIVFFISFIYIQAKVAKEPIISSHVLVRNVVSAVSTAFFNGSVFLASVFYVPIYYQVVYQRSVINAGLELLPLLLGVVFFSMIAGIVMVKIGVYRPLQTCGTLLGLLGTILMGVFLRPDISRAEQIIFLLMIGGGNGLCIQTNTLVCQAAVDTKDAAVVTSLVSFCQSLGGIIGITVLGSIYQNVLVSNLLKSIPGINPKEILSNYSSISALSPEEQVLAIAAYVEGFRYMFLGAIGFFAASFIATFFLKHIPLKRGEAAGAGH